MQSKLKIKQQFLNKLELFYRNFGSDWTIDDLEVTKSHQEIILPFLVELEKKKIISLNTDKKSFKIIDLPSNYKEL